MAVYTPVSPEEAAPFLERLGLGPPEALEPVPGGIENTNYRVRTGGRWYVLTLFEREPPGRVAETLHLARELARRGVPCPEPVQGPGGPVGRLKGRPAALVPWVEGRLVPDPDTEHLEALGGAVAALHEAGRGVPMDRGGLHLGAPLAARAREIARHLEGDDPSLARLLRDEAGAQLRVPEELLPAGVIHGDLFLDNVLFAPDAPRVVAILDLHMAGHGPLAYDLAVTLLDAAWEPEGVCGDRARALLRGYRSVRPLEGVEYPWIPWLLRRAALRFLCLRLERFRLPGKAMQLGRPKNPDEFRIKLEVLRSQCARWLQPGGTTT